MAPFAPFESAPRLAVAVSGGSDSLALTLLADRWATRRGGDIVALTVDHGLRPEAAAEAAQVGAWLAGRGIRHRVLVWEGAKPGHGLKRAGLQAAARAARRDLLAAECRRAGILHLLLGHHQDDQAETLVMRLAADSGPDGLAGMAACVESADLRLLRPLLAVPRARLAASLAALGQSWIEDPSNRDPRFSRARLRSLAAGTAAVAAPAAGFGRERAGRDGQVADLLARCVAVYPEGWASVAPDLLATAPPAIGRRALARLLMCVGGAAYPPRTERLERIYAAICGGPLAGGRTIAGCRLVPRRGGLLVVREEAAIGAERAVLGPGRAVWDGRFDLSLTGLTAPPGAVLRALGEAGWREVAPHLKSLGSLSLPPLVRASLPTLYDLDGVVEVPHLTYRRHGVDPDSVKVVSVNFRPRYALAGAGFASVSPADRRQ